MTRKVPNAVVDELRRSLRAGRPTRWRSRRPIAKLAHTRRRGQPSAVTTRLRSWLQIAVTAFAVLAVIASCVVGAASAHAAGLT